MNDVLVSCLMVTANRPQLVKRALKCFERQTLDNRELIIVDDGVIDLRELIDSSSAASKILYVKLESEPRLTLGELRNLSIESARGQWCCQWDDDEWYHPERLERQLNAAMSIGVGASALKWTLMRIETLDSNVVLNFRADTGMATPGTILFRRDVRSRYPARSRNEDGIFLRRVSEEVGVAILGREFSHLFVRVFHGSNTWEMKHFLKRLHRRPVDWATYLLSRVVWKDITRHRAFRLNKEEQLSIRQLSNLNDEVEAL